MNDDLIGLTATLAAVAVVLPLALVHGTHKAQQVQEAWRKLADRYRLSFEPARRVAGQTKVTGLLEGRSYVLQKSGSGNNARFSMELSLRGVLPAGLRMSSAGRVRATGSRDLGEPKSEAGRRGAVIINDVVRFSASDAAAVSAYLTGGRRRAALQLAEVGGEIEERKLRVTVSKTAADLEELDRALRTLAAVAPILDNA